ncbi:MAG: hypothetical protein ACYDB3_03670, partial [Acidimicrobiales bacterium]
GNTQTITIEQMPPKSVFASSDGSVIDDGTTTYFCSASEGQSTCVKESGNSNPLASLAEIFSPVTAIDALKLAQTEAAAHLAGYNVSFSSQSFAGQDSTCVSVTASGQTEKYCVTKSGILAFEGTSGSTFALTSYSTAVSDSDFSTPAGATVETIPGG